MHKNPILILAVVVSMLLIGVWWWYATSGSDSYATSQEEVLPDITTAEQVGVSFMQDSVSIASGAGDAGAAARVYAALTGRAQTEVSEAMTRDDIALFAGIQDVPDQEVRVENLEVHNPREVTVIFRLNDSSGHEFRAVDMLVEDGEWKVNIITPRESYLSEHSTITPPDEREQERDVAERSDCYVGGCSGQVCSDDPEVVTTCEWLEEYACYRDATCERQADGQCGWTETETLLQCLDTAGASLQ